MILTNDQLHNILDILDRQLLVFVGSTLGPQFLTPAQRNLLTSQGIDVPALYDASKDPVLLNFQLGLLSDILGGQVISEMSFDQLKYYIVSGQYIPLSARERATVNSIKTQALSDIRSNQSRIFQDINQVVNSVSSSERANQEEFLREEIIEGIKKRQSYKKISTELAKKTGDWSRNFYKSVQYISHTAMNEGRLAMVERRHEDSGSARVYFLVQPTACEHCTKAYLTAGPGSEPKLFTVKELIQNGSNIGRKAVDWLPTVQPMHVHCRCLLTEYHEGEEWNGSKFVVPKEAVYHPTVTRKKVRIIFNGTEYYV